MQLPKSVGNIIRKEKKLENSPHNTQPRHSTAQHSSGLRLGWERSEPGRRRHHSSTENRGVRKSERAREYIEHGFSCDGNGDRDDGVDDGDGGKDEQGAASGDAQLGGAAEPLGGRERAASWRHTGKARPRQVMPGQPSEQSKQ